MLWGKGRRKSILEHMSAASVVAKETATEKVQAEEAVAGEAREATTGEINGAAQEAPITI